MTFRLLQVKQVALPQIDVENLDETSFEKLNKDSRKPHLHLHFRRFRSFLRGVRARCRFSSTFLSSGTEQPASRRKFVLGRWIEPAGC